MSVEQNKGAVHSGQLLYRFPPEGGIWAKLVLQLSSQELAVQASDVCNRD